MNTPPRSSSSVGPLESVNWNLANAKMSLSHPSFAFEPPPTPPLDEVQDTSIPSSPDTRSIDCCHDPIPEEDEDGTASESVEPVTPTSARQSNDFRRAEISLDATGDSTPISTHIGRRTPPNKMRPLVLRTPTPPSTTTAQPPSNNSSQSGTNATAAPSSDGSAPPLLRRTATNATKRLSFFFRRSNSQTTSPSGSVMPTDQFAALSLNNAQGRGRRPSSFSMSTNATPATSQSNSPPSPGSPADTLHNQQQWQPDFSAQQLSRASTGLNTNNPVSRIMFSASAKPQRPSNRKRSTSMTDLKYVTDNNAITRPAATGAGLKARRMSACLPDDFDVDTVELKDEFASTSVVPGRRGKTVGTGATATVKLMVRRTGPQDVIFAVKEFRKRSKHENENEYVKKVKSEYAIAKSLRHPNIVETVRLCTHSGRWNHVMEYCAQGDLHTLVAKGYLKDADHLCLFKQLLRGVAYLHGHGIAHRDIKLQNLLMTTQGQLKITDFGVSEVFSGEHPGLRGVGLECGKNMKESRRCAPGICGSKPYIAPEVLSKKGDYDPRPLDIWSCAIVYLTMKYKGNPWSAAEPGDKLYDKFSKGWEAWFEKNPDREINEGPDGWPKCGPVIQNVTLPALKRLILKMTHPNPDKRIQIQDVVNDRWVKQIECCVLENEAACDGVIDASAMKSCRLAAKSGVKKLHNHLPPAKAKTVYDFDLGDGY